jgi:hypothetical protein
MLFKEITAFYYENHMKHINTLYRQNAELLAVKSSGILSFIALKWYQNFDITDGIFALGND